MCMELDFSLVIVNFGATILVNFVALTRKKTLLLQYIYWPYLEVSLSKSFKPT